MTTSTSVLFVAHGSPLFVLQPGAAGAAFAELSNSLGRPKAVLAICPPSKYSPTWPHERHLEDK